MRLRLASALLAVASVPTGSCERTPPVPEPLPSSGAVAMFRGDEGHVGVYAGTALRHRPSVAWKYVLRNREASAPTVCDGVVYVEAGRNGDTTWPEGALHALDARTGRLLWKVATGNGGAASPAVAHGLVYFVVDDDVLHALDARNGAPHWTYRLSRSRRDRTRKNLSGSATLSGDSVFFNVTHVGKVAGAWVESLHALDARTGRTRWKTDRVQATTSPVVHGGLVFTARYQLAALVAKTGAKKWEYTFGEYEDDGRRFDDYAVDSPAAADGVLHVATFGGSFHALDAASGRLLWRFERAGYTARAAPAVANGTVFVGAVDGHLHALDAKTGTERWRFRAEAQVNSTPSVAEDVVYFGDWDGNLYALDANSGKELWRFRRDGMVILLPVTVHDGTIYATGLVRGGRDRYEVLALR